MAEADLYIQRLEELPYVRAATFVRAGRRSADAEYDGELSLRTETGTHNTFALEYKTNLSRGSVHQLIDRARSLTKPLLVLAPYVGAPIGALLASNGVNYIDRQGNCDLRFGKQFAIHVEGRSATRQSNEHGIRAAGYKVLFSLLADPRLLDDPLRTIAAKAEVSTQAVVTTRRRLQAEGAIVQTAKRWRWVPRRIEGEVQRWLHGYRDVVRPAILKGTFRMRPQIGDEEVSELLRHHEWAWGGASAAYRLTRHYRSDRTVVHLGQHVQLPLILKAIKALPDPNGNLVVMDLFGPVDPVQHLVHPLLAYSELMAGDDERALEAAQELFTRLVEPIWKG